MIEIEIDGKKITTDAKATIIEAADAEGIYIPRFCYHKKLSVAANCRMCLVEVDKVNKPLPACATPITPNMKVLTRSKMAQDAQRAVMEYLLINHPLDCPICDQGGECELQDLAMGYGLDHSDYEQNKRSVIEEDLGPLVATGMTRCIHCTRCVRFGDEVVGMPELGATGRGEKMRIGTYVKHLMQSELSGNVIDLCPVGALISKPYLFSARGWELCETPMIAPHDCWGSNLFVHSRSQEYVPQREVMRVVPRENEAINEAWISDRDRFSYLSLQHVDRLLTPKIKRDGKWRDISWQEALCTMVARLDRLFAEHCREQLAALVSPSATLEECYLLQKWLRALGSPHIDHRLRLQDFSDQHLAPIFPKLGISIAAINNLKAILLVGIDAKSEQPLLLHRIRQAAKQGAKIMSINPINYNYPFSLTAGLINGNIIYELAEVVASLAHAAGEHIPLLANIHPSDTAKIMANELQQAKDKAAIFMGDFANNHPAGSTIRALLRLLVKYTGCIVGAYTEGANSSGAWLAGAVPHRGAFGAAITKTGLHAQALLTDGLRRAYVLLGVELEYDSSYSAAALAALQQAEFVVCMNVFTTEKMLEYADLILPIAPFTENEGTFVNVTGDWQDFTAVTVPHGEAKPAWKIIQMLAKLMQLEGFAYDHVVDITKEIKAQADLTLHLQSEEIGGELPATLYRTKTGELARYAPWPIYRIDGFCRRSIPLQQTNIQAGPAIVVHPEVAMSLQLIAGEEVIAKQGQASICLPLHIDNRVSPNIVLLPSGLQETAGFGQANLPISLERVVS